MNVQVGDRVAAFHEMLSPGGSYAEYAVAWAHTTFHIPKQTSFEGRFVLKVGERNHANTNHQQKPQQSRKCSFSSLYNGDYAQLKSSAWAKKRIYDIVWPD